MQFIRVLCLADCFLSVVLSNSVMSSSVIPSSSVVVLGARVKLSCSIQESDSPTWKYTSFNTSSETIIYYGSQIINSLRSRYKIDKNISGQHNLIIDSVDLAHAGRYQCLGVHNRSLMLDVQLIVLGSYPVCASNISETQFGWKEQINLTIWCRIIYAGTPKPVFTWTKSNEEEENIAAKAINSGTKGEPLSIDSSIMQPLHANDSGVTFQCQITFQNPNSSADNIYAYTWNYTLCGNMNLSIARYEDRLECSAYGSCNPTPSYRWTNVESNKSTDGHVLVLNGTVTTDNDHTFICTASNIFAAENINITVKGTAKDSSVTQGDSGLPFTAIAIGGSILLLIIIAIIVSCVVHRKRLKDNSSERPDVALNTDINTYDEIASSSGRSSNFILEENRSPGRSDSRTISDNPVYSEVRKPNVRTNGNSGGNICDNAPPKQTPTRKTKNLVGADGTEYAELSGVKPPSRKGEFPKQPAFSRVEVYASIDHNGKAPPPPPQL